MMISTYITMTVPMFEYYYNEVAYLIFIIIWAFCVLIIFKKLLVNIIESKAQNFYQDMKEIVDKCIEENPSMKSPVQLNNLRSLLPTQESRMELAQKTGIPLPQINNWLDPNKESITGADVMVELAKHLGCSIEYLLDLMD